MNIFELKLILIQFFILSLILFFIYNIFLSIETDKIIELSIEKNKTNKFQTEEYLEMKIKSYKRGYKIRNIVACVIYESEILKEILFHYLNQNLRKNGGILDKILVLLSRSKYKAIEQQADEGYEFIIFDGRKNILKTMFKFIHHDDLIFKIDGDIVFIANGTFENMVDEYLKNDHFILSANVINHHIFSCIHARMDLMKPFAILNNSTLLLQNNATVGTTIIDRCTDDFKCWKTTPYCGAVAHESFLYNIYKNDFNLNSYNFSLYDINKDGYRAWGINFILFRGNITNKTVFLDPNKTLDEKFLTQVIAKFYKRHSFAMGSVIVSHFSHSTSGQIQYLTKTNLLEKYKKLSNDYLKFNHYNFV